MRTLGSDVRQDAMLTNRDLEAIDNTLYEVKEAELKARQLVGLKTDIPAGAETYTYNKITRRGAAKIFAHGADDVPLVDNDIARTTQGVYSVVAGFTLGLQEKRAAQMAGVAIDTAKAATARKAIAAKENSIFFAGDDEYGIEGITNTTGIQVYTVPAGASTKTTWADKTPKEIVADIRNGRSKVNTVAGMNADTLVLPVAQYELLSQLMSDNSPLTILVYLEQQKWFTRIISDDNLDKAGADASDCFLIFDSSRENMELGIPLDLQRYAPVVLPNLSEQVNCEERTTGIIVRFPTAICRGDGI